MSLFSRNVIINWGGIIIDSQKGQIEVYLPSSRLISGLCRMWSSMKVPQGVLIPRLL